jgi:hypothetical protein
MKPVRLAALAAAAAGLLAMGLLRPEADAPAHGASGADAPVATAPRALQVLAWSVPAAPAAVRAGAQPLRGSAAAAPVELCGLGQVLLTGPAPAGDVPPDLADLPGPIGEQALAQAREGLLARLRQGDTRQRAIALLLARPPDEPADAARAWAGELLGLARHSGLPELLHWAEPACSQQADPGACRLALVRERLRLEPDNAAHWAALADEDPAAGDAAWAGLQQARRWHERPQSLVLATQAALPPDLPGYLRLALAREMKLRTQQLPSAGEGFVLERCTQPVPGRTAACAELAALLSQRSDSLRTLTEAAAVAQAAGLPAPHVQALRQEFHALLQADPLDPPLPDADRAPLGCARLHAWQQHLDDTARLGELGALRQRRVGS